MRWLILALLLVPAALAIEPTGFVTDTADMIPAEEEAELEAILGAIERNTTAEIAVLTIPSLEGRSLEEYATSTFREWGVGKEDVDNGILILIVQDTRDIRIEVGLGLEGVVTDARAGILIRNRLTPAFRQGEHAGGIALAATDIAKLAQQDPATVSAYERAERPSMELVPVLALILAYAVVMTAAAFIYRKDKERKENIRRKASSVVVVIAFIMTMFVSSSILWLVLFFIIMINVTTTGSAGFLFMPGPGRGRFGGGRGGFGGFGGGFSGGGGASGGW